MQRMRKRILSEQDSGCSQDPAHGGIAAQMSSLREKLQPKKQPENASSHAHGRAARFESGSSGRIGIEDRSFRDR